MPNVLLSIVMATMASLSTAMLGLGQRSIALPAMTLLAAVASVILTDRLGWFQLNRFVANAAMLLAAVFSLQGFLESGSQQQLWAIANLLTYVQMVLLFQEKSQRVYGQLAMFSLLQVVVAALLNNGLEFGLLLCLYMTIALFGFVLFFVYREAGRVGMVVPRRWWFFTAETTARETQFADRLPILEVVDDSAALNRSIITRRIVPPILAVVAATTVFTAVAFYVTPRSDGENWERGLARRNLVGFSPEVSFDEMGLLLASDQRVMRVSFTNARTEEAYTVIGEPYLRGVVLTKYIDGHWRQEIRSSRAPMVTLGPPPDVRDLVQQDILIEPTGNNRLFSMFPVYAIAQKADTLRIDPRTRHLLRYDSDQAEVGREEYRYTVATSAFRFGAQLPVIPHPNQLQTAADRASMDLLNRWMRHIDSPESLPQLIALADQVVRAKAPNGSSYERARALESHFTEGQLYQYTLDMDAIRARRQAGVDPIEDFVSNHRMGHCEYFASALTLMLRSQGIPARLVVGYRPSEFNYLGNYFAVRQRDAHAWVEAYLKAEEIPTGMLYPEEQHAGGGWLRLDPTPADDQAGAANRRDVLDRVSKSFDYARWLWSDYVQRLTEERQRRAILDPLALDSKISLSRLFNTLSWTQLLRQVTGTSLRELLERGFSWRGGLAAILVCAVAFAGYRLLRRSLPRLFQWSRRQAPPRYPRRATVAFYQQMESLLARIGLRRGISQTQRQFAGAAAAHLAASPRHAAAADVPHQIVDAFYLARFGGQTPDPAQDAQILQRLKKLEDTLAN